VTELAEQITRMGQAAREASRVLAKASPASKSTALKAIAEAIDGHRSHLVAANYKDLELGQAKGLATPLLDRLVLDDSTIDRMIQSIQEVDALADPIGRLEQTSIRPSGISVGRMRVPLGVIGIIYESRPNVTVDASILCLKTGNAVILRGGSEALSSNQALVQCIHRALAKADLPETSVQLIATSDRAAVGHLIRLSDYLDLLVPRGGRGLIERINSEATVPVIKHLDGVCHLYIDRSADFDKAIALAVNSKVEKLAVCCALETLLLDSITAKYILPVLAKAYAKHSIELRGCDRACEILPEIKAATDEDWYQEYLGPILAVKVVDDLDAAIRHINHYGSMHTDSIVAENQASVWRFLREVDSASVMANASTQFADGFEFGLGAEIGISTDKLHARGPVGLEGLTSAKFVVFGQGHTRDRSQTS